MKATIKDISADTGLSLATISKYLNNKSIRPENRMLIEASIQKLNYIPNTSAQVLRSKHSHTIGVITPTLNNSFWGSILEYLEETLRQYGYSVIFCSHQENDDKVKSTIHALLDKKIDGAVIIPYSQYDYRLIEALSVKIPCIALDHVLKDMPIDAVTSTNFEGGYQATKYLIEHGHRRIGILTGSKTGYTSSERTAGYLAALADYSIPVEKELIIYSDSFSTLEGKRALQKLTAISPPPTAVFAANYDMSLGSIIEAGTEGYLIPDDLSIIGFDDDIILSSMRPRITVIAQNVKELGRQTAHLLVQRIEGTIEDNPTLIKVKTTLIERDSVKTL